MSKVERSWDNSDAKDGKGAAPDFERGFSSSLRRLGADFLHGLIVIIPLAVTVWLLVWLFDIIDGILAPVVRWGFGRPVPGLGFVIIVATITLIGFLAVRIRHRRFFELLESRIVGIAFVGGIYGTIRQILNSVASNTPRKFLEVVFVEYPRKGIYAVGLVTGEIKDKNGMKVLNVFIPTSPNPTGGFLQMVPESDVVKTSMSIDDAIKLIVSAGKVSPGTISEALLQVPEPQIKT
jgi:uncharacterized membrane protein